MILRFIEKLIRKIDRWLHPAIGEIWMLHRITNSKSLNPYYHRWEISPSFFEQTIQEHIQKGYQFISIDEVCRYLNVSKSIQPFVCMTFDDGYQDIFTEALPILEKYHIPFCIYVTPGYVLGNVNAREDESVVMLNKEQVIKLSQHPLCTIGSHTMMHPHLNQLDYGQQRAEIVNARMLLEQWIEQPVRHFASPYGSYNEDTVHIVKEIDLCSHVTIKNGPVRRNSNLQYLPRVEIREL